MCSFIFMYRRKSYSARRYKKVRYSNETSTFNITTNIAAASTTSFPDYQGNLGKTLVSAAEIQGTRKVKNMTLSISTSQISVPVLCTVVYVPQGTQPSGLTVNGSGTESPSSLYEPNQNVIMQFVLNPVYANGEGSCVQRFKTRLARNLDSGDCIKLIMAPSTALTAPLNGFNVTGTFNYAISF